MAQGKQAKVLSEAQVEGRPDAMWSTMDATLSVTG